MRYQVEKIRSLGIFCLLFILFFTSQTSDGAPEQSVELVDISIDKDRVSVDIGFNGTNSAHITVTVVLLADLGIIVEYVDVYIEPEIPQRVSLVLDSYELRLTSDEPQQQIKGNISVEPQTSSSLDPVLRIGGSARTDRGQTVGVNDDGVSIDVLPYYGSNIFFSNDMGTVNIGGSMDFKLNIENTGNVGEHFILEVVNTRELSSNGISVEFEEARVYLEEKGSKIKNVKIRAGEDVGRGAYVIKIRCYPETIGPSTQEQSTASLTINVDRGVIDSLEGFFKEPIYFYITIAVVLILLILGIYGIYRLKQHLAWKRTLKRIRSAGAEDDPVPSDSEAAVDIEGGGPD